MKKQLGVLLLVFTVSMVFSGIATTGNIVKAAKYGSSTNINNQYVYAPDTIINRHGAVDKNINSPSGTTASNSKLDQSTRNSPRNVEGTTGLHLGAD